MRTLPRRLYIRLTLFSLLALIIACGAIFAAIAHFGTLASAESLQRQNLGLASYLMASQRAGFGAGQPDSPILNADGEIVKPAFSKLLREVRRINPTLEIYLVGFDGSILAHAGEMTLPVSQIEPAPLEMLGARRIAAPKLPILGDDPRRPGRKAVISVAALLPDDSQAGYLYLVLDGASAAGLGPITDSNMLNTMLALVAAIILLAGVCLAWLLNSALRPLSVLTERVQAFRGQKGQEQSRDRRSDEIALLAGATAQMQSRIEAQFTNLEQAEQQRRELINQVTHDLQTPLASVRGYLETLLLPNATVNEQTRQAYLQTALRHTRSLSRRVTDLFELSNLQAGTTPFEPESFSLAELVHDLASDYSPKEGHQQASVRVASDCVVPANVMADIGLLERALRNLLDNAIRHTAADGDITVSIMCDPDQSRAWYWLRVCDDGEGIDAASVPHIFQSAWSGRQSSHHTGSSREAEANLRSVQGTGLGLHIVRQIALLHGGEPFVKSTPGQGTCISFAVAAYGEEAELKG